MNKRQGAKKKACATYVSRANRYIDIQASRTRA
jgi:hypothetical protein